MMPDKDIFLFYEKEMNLVINIWICYNAIRQKDAEVPCEQRMESPNRVPAQFGDSSLLLWWQSTHQATCCSCRHRLTI